MAKRQNIHIVPHGEGWGVRREGSTRVSSNHPTQAAAAAAGRTTAQRERGELFIHGTNGQIRARNSYGNDPCPPKDSQG
jgi:hypothetical protein